MSKYIAPDEIRVGFNKRSDTFSGMLGFMIYRNKADGNYGWDKSFTGWIDKTIPEKMISNEFQTGFVINKGQKRFHHYGGNVKIRVYHPEGFEFEIPLDNLAFLLHNCTIEKSEIQNKCIVAWEGSNPYLIPEIMKDKVEIKKIQEAKKKLDERKFIPAASCRRFEFYETESGVEFNLGKLASYDIAVQDGLILLTSARGAQASLPISYFDNNLDMREKVFECIVGSKKLKEAQVSEQIKSIVEKNKDLLNYVNPYYGYNRNYNKKEIFLKSAEHNFHILNNPMEIKELEGDTLSILKSAMNSLFNIKYDKYDNKVIVIPKTIRIKEKDYYYLFSSQNMFNSLDNLISLKKEGQDYIYEMYRRNSFSSTINNMELNGCFIEKEIFENGNNLLTYNGMFKAPNFSIFVDYYGKQSDETQKLNSEYQKDFFEVLEKFLK